MHTYARTHAVCLIWGAATGDDDGEYEKWRGRPAWEAKSVRRGHANVQICMYVTEGLEKKAKQKRKKDDCTKQNQKKIGIFRSIDTRYICLDARTDGQMDG